MCIFKGKPLTAQNLADDAQRILNGEDHGLDVDLYEHANPKDLRLRDLHIATLHFGLPEEWKKLNEADKSRLRGVIEEMRNLTMNGS